MGFLPEPHWGGEQRVDRDPSSLSSTGISPTIITGLLIRLLEAHFYTPENIRNKYIRDYIWADTDVNVTDVKTKINILPGYKYDPRLIDHSPSIFVKREDITVAKFSLGGKALTHLDQNGSYNGENYLRLITGTHSIMCCSKGAFNSESLAEEVMYRLMEYTPAIKEDLKFSEFEVKGLTSAKKLEEGNDKFCTIVPIAWQTIYSWVLQPIAPILKKIHYDVKV